MGDGAGRAGDAPGGLNGNSVGRQAQALDVRLEHLCPHTAISTGATDITTRKDDAGVAAARHGVKPG
ncbi:MAG: hypothetical protein WCI17_00885 [bacterium]